MFFKPYKLARYFNTDVNDLERPTIFKENCLSVAYVLIALFTDYVFDMFKVELEKLEGSDFKVYDNVIACKKKMF